MIEMRDIQQVADNIAREFDPEQIILFGSYAYGRPKEHSDVDLLVVMEYEGDMLDRSVEISCAVSPPFPSDLIIFRPGELRRRYDQFNPIAREALNRGKVLYERRSARVAG